MKHRNKKKILSRKIGPRKALIRIMAINFLLKEKIKTTEAKAKAVRPIIERLISSAGTNDLATRRKIIASLNNIEVTKKLLENIGPRYKERAGGYIRIIKIGRRRGDAAEMVFMELVK
ncbi:MAG: 50S ribosomal protein L17 [Patescibacteria group bacterium]